MMQWLLSLTNTHQSKHTSPASSSNFAQVVEPLCLHAIADMTVMKIDDIGGPETIQCQAKRTMRQWIRVPNGGHTTTNGRAFQDS